MEWIELCAWENLYWNCIPGFCEAKKHVDKVLVVDDGSTDSTAGIAEALGALVVRHEENRGYGAAIRT